MRALPPAPAVTTFDEDRLGYSRGEATAEAQRARTEPTSQRRSGPVHEEGMTSIPELFAAGEKTGVEGTYVGFASGFQVADGIDRFVQSGKTGEATQPE